MKKIIFLILFFFPFNILALTYPSLYSDHVLVYDRTTNTLLYEKNSTEQTNIASLTKILTTITALEHIDNLDTYITYTPEMAALVSSELSIAHLKVGTSYSYRDLLYASMLPSGADATTALALSLSSSIPSYVAEMNELATTIGMAHSHFENVTGLDEENHYSTLSDLLILLNYALNNETFKTIYTTKEYTLSSGSTIYSTIKSYNPNNNYDTSKILGSKTGFTAQAGLCISVLFKTLDHELLLITTNAPKTNANYNIVDALTIIDFVQENYSYETIAQENDLITTIPVNYSNIDEYQITSPSTITKFLPSDYNHHLIRIEYSGLEELSYQTKEGTHLGTISYYYADTLCDTAEIYLDIPLKLDIIKLIKAYKMHLIILILILSTITSLLKTKKQSRLKKKVGT